MVMEHDGKCVVKSGEEAFRGRIVAAARGWLGTPYVHQASCKGAGADCLGLVRGVWREVVGAEPAAVPPYSADWGEPRREEVLWQAARELMEEISPADAWAGDVLLFRMCRGATAKHLGILMRNGEIGHEAGGWFIHAYSGHGVVESPLSLPWRRRIVAAFRFPMDVAPQGWAGSAG